MPAAWQRRYRLDAFLEAPVAKLCTSQFEIKHWRFLWCRGTSQEVHCRRRDGFDGGADRRNNLSGTVLSDHTESWRGVALESHPESRRKCQGRTRTSSKSARNAGSGMGGGNGLILAWFLLDSMCFGTYCVDLLANLRISPGGHQLCTHFG